jgi:hypothetical protein
VRQLLIAGLALTFQIEQKQNYLKEAESCQQSVAVINPIETMRQKAVFLLKFAGLSKVNVQLQVNFAD